MPDSPGEAARFLTRNAVEALPEGELERQLEQDRPLRVKLGVDPTTPDIHLGHTVVLRKLREFQDLGHTVVLIIGDYTARVGDPSGRSSVRPDVDPAEIDRNADTYTEQAFKVLDRERTEVRRNGEWLDMPMEDLFRLARTSTVAQILERDDFAKRYSARPPDHRSSSCSTRCSRATTRWPCARTWSSAAPTRSSTSSSRATSSRPTACRRSRC